MKQNKNNNKLLSQFGLNKAITGPFAKVIQAEIGQQMWDDITNFRQHRLGTYEMLKAFEDYSGGVKEMYIIGNTMGEFWLSPDLEGKRKLYALPLQYQPSDLLELEIKE